MNSITLTRWIRKTELFMVQSHVESKLCVMVSASLLDGPVQHWYMFEENTLEFAFLDWVQKRVAMVLYLRLMDEWKALKQGDGQLTVCMRNNANWQLVLELQHLHPSTKLHGFVSGLRPCIQMVVENMCPESCEEAMRVADWINDIEAHMHPMYGNQLATLNNRSWMPKKNSMGRGLTRREVSRNQWTSNMGWSLFLLPR